MYDRSNFAHLVAEPHPDLESWIEDPRMIVNLFETPITPVSFGAYDRSDGHIPMLCTSPDYQGEGLAGRLLDRFLAVAREEGTSRVKVSVPRNAEDFFKHHDFRPHRQESCGGLDLTRMHRPLP